MNIAKSLNVALALKGMTRVALAKSMNVTTQSIYSVINRDKTNTASLKKIADALDMKVSEFIALGED